MTEFANEVNQLIKESLTADYANHSFLSESKVNCFTSTNSTYSQQSFIGLNSYADDRVSYQPNFRVFNNVLEDRKTKLLGDHEVFGGTMLVRYQGDRLAKEFGVPGYEIRFTTI